MGTNQVNITTFYPSDIKNGHHTRFAKAVQSVITLLTLQKLQRSPRSQIQVSCCQLILLFELMSPDNSSSFSMPSVPEFF